MSEKIKYILTPVAEQQMEDMLTDEGLEGSRDKWLYQKLRIAAVNASKNVASLQTDGKLVLGDNILTITKADFDKVNIPRDESYKPPYEGKLSMITLGSYLYNMLHQAAALQNCLNKQTTGRIFASMEEYIQSLITVSILGEWTTFQEKILIKEENELVNDID